MTKPSYAELEHRVAELQEEVARNKRYARINRSLFDIAAAVSSSSNLSELFPSIHQSLAAIIDTTNFYIALYDASSNSISFPYEVDVTSSDCSPLIGVTGRESLTARVLESRQPLLITRNEIERQRSETGWAILHGNIPEIWLGVPLIACDSLIGAMVVQSYEGPSFYDSTDVETMNAVAAQVAIAIERKQIEGKLQESVSRFRRILDNVAEISIQGYDEKRRVTFWNPASEKVYGYSEQEALGRQLEELIIPVPMRADVIRLIDRWVKEGEAIPAGELVLVDKYGNDVPVFSSHVMSESVTGKEMFCIDLDLKPIKQAEELLREANAKFHAAMDSLDAMVYVADMESYELLFLNTKTRESSKAKVGDLCWASLQAGQSNPCAFCTNDRLVDKDGQPTPPLVWEFQNTKSGLWFQCRDQAIRWPDGRLVRLEIAVDITDRKNMELALKDSEERFRVLHDASFGGICIHEQGKILECNNALVELSGFSREELIGSNGFQMIAPEWRQLALEKVNQKSSDPYIVEGVRRDGTRIHIRSQGKEIPFQGRMVRVAEFQDVSAGIRAERALQESERKHRIIFENSPLGMIYFEDDGTILDCNEKFVEMMGSDRSSLIGFNTARQTSPLMQASIKKALAGEQSSYEDRYTSVTGGRTIYLRVMFNPVNPGVSPSTVIATLEDITERKKAEEALRESAERFKTFFSAINDAVFVHPIKSEGFAPFIEVNDIACERYGYTRDEFLQLSAVDVNSREYTSMHGTREHRQRLKELGNLVFEAVHVKKSGEEFPVEINASIIEQGGKPMILAVVRDISDRKNGEREREKLEDQLRQAQKLESIGRLAGGVAHDFNNMLGVILGRTEMIMDDVQASLPFQEDLQEIHKAASRSAALTRQLLIFARKQTVVPQVIDLNEKVADVHSLLRRLIGEDIEFFWQPCKDVWKVQVDPGQVDQILTNLCINARDAIVGNGRITITLANLVVDREHGLASEGLESLQPGEFVVLRVADNGCGIAKDDLDKLFDPFFTTKEVGKGTGLGLATVYGIARQNHGFVEVKSVPGQGTVFSIYFPRSGPARGETAEAPAQSVLPGENKTVLLVEDEPAILAMTQTMLKRLGFKVLAANSPGEALRQAVEHRAPIDILLTDIIMPEMDGWQLAEKIADHHPGIARILMSGYTDDVIGPREILSEGAYFIQKPFTKNELAKILSKIISTE